MLTAASCAQKGRRSACWAATGASSERGDPAPGRPSKRKVNRDMVGPSSKRYGFATMLFLAVASNCDSYVHFVSGKRLDGLCPGNPTSRAPDHQGSVPAKETGPDMGAALDCPSAEGLENMYVTNSEVERTMNHRCRRAVLQNPCFSKEAFGAFSSADAYIRAA